MANNSTTAVGLVRLAAVAVLCISACVLLSQLNVRLDVTAERLHTLSKGSRDILANLPEPVTLKYFFSRDLGEVDVFLKTYAGQVESLLRDYVRAAKGNLALEVHYPMPDSDEEEWARQYGIEPQTFALNAPPMFFGVAAISADGRTQLALPSLSPRTESTLEYELTRMISRVASPSRPVVGVLAGLDVLGRSPGRIVPPSRRGRQRGWFSFEELGRDADIRSVEPDATAIDPAIQTLVVVHPNDLSPATMFAIDQFVLRGGRLMVFVDPFSAMALSESAPEMELGMAPAVSSDLPDLFKAWGVGYESDSVVVDLDHATLLAGPQGAAEENPSFLTLDPSCFAKDPLVSDWGMLLLPFSGEFTFDESTGLVATPILLSSEHSGVVPTMAVQFGAKGVRARVKPDGRRHILAARLTGRFKTAFPDGAPKPGADDADGDEAKDDKAKDGSALKEGDGTVLLFADSDLLQDDVCVRRNMMMGYSIPTLISDNFNLFVSAVEMLCGDSALLSIRTRGRTLRPFGVVDEIERKAQAEYLEREQELEQRLRETQERIQDLQQKKTGAQRSLLSPEQQAEIAKFRKEERECMADLKNVRRNLNRDIEALGTRVKVLNILSVPLLVSLFGIAYGLRRRARAHRR